MDPPDSYIGSPRSIAAKAVDAWPAEVISDEYRVLRDSNIETLAVNGDLDVFTPARYISEDLMPTLPNGQEVILENFSHVGDLYFAQSAATERLLSSFFDSGVGDTSLYTPRTIDFEFGLGLPAITKLTLGGITALVLGGAALTAWLLLR